MKPFAAYCASGVFDPNQCISWDKAFGIDSPSLSYEESRSEAAQRSSPQIGLGKDPRGLWTPYPWLHMMFHNLTLLPGSTVCDVGAGIGRLGLYLQQVNSPASYIGLELIPARAAAAREARVNVRAVDIEYEGIPDADVYYFYNALARRAYNHFLYELDMKKRLNKHFLVVSARDPFDQIKTILTELTRIHIDTPTQHDFVIYSSCEP